MSVFTHAHKNAQRRDFTAIEMSICSCSAFLLCFGLTVAAAVDLRTKYPFSSVLLDQGGQYYALYWNFTRTTESIYFAVNVSTTGWVGFGLSPNEQMPGSDVVIGWVSSAGQTYFAVSCSTIGIIADTL